MMSAVVHAQRSNGRWSEARVLLDTCSTANFITMDLAKRLHLSIQPCELSVDGMNNMHTESKGSAEVLIKSRVTGCQKRLQCLVVSEIKDRVPNSVFPRELVEIPANLPLADPQFHLPRTVDILVCSGTTMTLFSIGQIKLSRDNCDLCVQKTQLGWVVVGGVNDAPVTQVSCNLLELNRILTKFWEVEECLGEIARSREDIRCEEHYAKHTTRNHEGRYVVRLPFKTEEVDLGDSKSQALRRFSSLQRRFRSHVQLQNEYTQVIQDYIDKGHATRIERENPQGYFLPHHAVLKPTSTTTKVRVVFDASAKTDKGHSLNQMLLTGPSIQPKLFAHLLYIRTPRFVVMADIEQMYRQVILDPRDRRYQQILWQFHDGVQVFELNTVTSAAPYLAIRTLHRLADDEGDSFPRASIAVKENFYVDDFFYGADTVEEVGQMRDEVIELLRRGGFHIRRWASNHQHALDSLDHKDLDHVAPDENGEMRKALGIGWNALSDNLIYSVHPVDHTQKITKRTIISVIARIFDPLGLLGPVTLALKIIIQDCWKLKVGWDETVPQALHTKWQAIASQLHLIKGLAIPRHLVLPEYMEVQIHGFCDASQSGYGACLYIRSSDADGRVLVQLACAKSRVAPVKQQTIPRLELCGAVLLTRLLNEARSALKLPVRRITFWTDSEIVLLWIQRMPQTLQVFEGNRVAEIQRASEDIEWRHVPGKLNPADALSRGQTPVEFLRNDTWFNGFSWLRQPEAAWPETRITPLKEVPGLKKTACLLNSSSPARADSKPFYCNISSYYTLINVIAYCLRVRHPYGYPSKFLDRAERDAAERVLWRLIQHEKFKGELESIRETGTTKNTRLAAFSPFIDEFGVLRVGGRLTNAQIPTCQKYPVLLPSYHHVTDLIIRRVHSESLHAGLHSTLFAVRHRFWLLDGRNQVRKIIRQCNACIRYRPTTLHSKMSDLPSSRVQQSAVFSHVGVDFFGPISLKEKKFRNRSILKGYGCVFICMSTKAVHLELANDLSTEGFLAALRRFIGRRGMPSHVYSDNGTNFVGANNELNEIYRLHASEPFHTAIYQFGTQRGIVWHFNPPLSPHFGGIWEAAVKSCKHHLRRVLGTKILTFEEFNTLLIEVESILNSRPIGLISADPNDPTALTPAHFLIGRPLTMIPQPDFTSVPENRLSSWRFITRARQDFWKRWHVEYLSELHKRQKWIEGKGEINPGSVVIEVDKDRPCNQWPLAVVVEVFPGNDGVTRVAKIRTSAGEYVRNVTRLCPLPHVTE